MRFTSFVRRSTAVAAATALISSGGAVSGLLAAPAYAAGCAGGSATCVTGTSIAYWDNSGGAADFSVLGANLAPAAVGPIQPADPTAATVTFTLHSDPSWVFTATAVSATATSLRVQPTFPIAPPGLYDVQVTRHTALGDQPSNTCTKADGCDFTVLNVGGAANATAVVQGSAPGRLSLTGQHIAHGASVRFYLPGTNTVDAGLTFTPANDTGDTASPAGYLSTTSLHGTYAQGAFTAGQHDLAVVNTDSDASGTRVAFWQPSFAAAGVSPSSLPAGAPATTLTINGHGFGPNSTLSISKLSASNSACFAKEVTVANQKVVTHVDGSTTFTADVAFDSCAPGGPRTLTLSGPTGGYYSVAGALSSTPAPTVTNINGTTPYTVGAGADVTTTVNGTNFATGATSAALPSFDLGGDVLEKTLPDATNSTTKAKAHLLIAEGATLGSRAVKVTNPDGGSSATATTVVTITPGPSVDPNSVDGGSALPGQTASVTIKGSNFDTTNGMAVSLVSGTDPDGFPVYESWAVGPVSVTGGSPQTVHFTVTIPAGTAPGFRDIRLRNLGDNGAVTCVECFAIDSMSVTDLASGLANDLDNGVKTLKLSGAGIGVGDQLELIKLGDPAYQPHLAGTVTSLPDATSGAASVDLQYAAPGKYGAVLVTQNDVLFCGACFTVLGTQVGIGTITPHVVGQGALHVPVTITAASGKTFARGMQVTVADETTQDVTWVNPTTITVLVDATGAATGAKDVTVANADGVYSATVTGGFQVNQGPAVTSISPVTLGQGAGTQSAGATETVTVSGTGFVHGASPATSSTLDLGPGVTIVSVSVVDAGPPPLPVQPEPADTLTATIKVLPGAAVGPRDVVVLNPDLGRGVLAHGFTVAAGPVVTSVTPASLPPGASGQSVTIVGTGFAANAVPSLAGLSLSGVTVSADHTRITGTVSVPSGTALGTGGASVSNPTDKGYGACACFVVAVPPSAPQAVALASGPGSVTASWAAPTSNGGAVVTGYHLVLTQVGLVTPTAVVDVAATTLNRTFTGLRNGTGFTLAVSAVNVAGAGAVATAKGIAGLPASLSLTTNTGRVVYGSRVIVTGRLLGTAGVPLAERTVLLSFAPAVGRGYVRQVTTNTAGAFSLGVISPYTVRVQALWAGDASYRTVSSALRGWYVATRVLRTAPATGSTSRATTLLKVTGNVGPNKGGRTVILQRYLGSGRWTTLQGVRLSSTSAFAFAVKPARGTYVLRITIGATPGNLAGTSSTFKVYRV